MIPAFLFTTGFLAPEPTNVVREISKCSTPAQILFSGDKTRAAAERLAMSIQQRKDFVKKDVALHSVQEFESATQPGADAQTVVALVAREELDRLPSKLSALFTGLPSSFDAESGTLITQQSRAKAGQITFDSLIEVPLAVDMNGAIDTFTGFSTDNWRNLKFNNQLKVNRVYASGANVLGWIPGWGTLPGNVINSVIPSDPGAEGDPSSDQVYFWNRSNSASTLPAALKPLAESIKLNPLTYAALRQQQNNGHYLSLYIAPSEKTLEHLASRFPNLQTLGDPGFISQVNDLRESKRTLVLTSGPTIDKDVVYTMNGYLESDLRDKSHLNLLPRTNVPNLLGQSDLTTDSAAKLRKDYGVRWVVAMELSDGVGTVEYRPEEICLSSDPAKFADTAPNEPSRGRKSDDEWTKAQEKYRKDYADWTAKRNKYEYDDKVSWRKNIVKKSYGQVHMSIKLIDLQDNSKVIWLGDHVAKVEETVIFRTENETMNGHMRKPRPLDCPRPESNSAAVLKTAGARALAKIYKDFIGESLLPSEDVNVSVSELEIKTIAVESPIITINAGEAQGIKMGDHVTVEIFRDIVDPNTKDVIERVPLDKVTLEVVRVGKTSDCKALTPKDVDLLAKIKVGDSVQIVKK